MMSMWQVTTYQPVWHFPSLAMRSLVWPLWEYYGSVPFGLFWTFQGTLYLEHYFECLLLRPSMDWHVVTPNGGLDHDRCMIKPQQCAVCTPGHSLQRTK